MANQVIPPADDADDALIALAETVLANYFFDMDNEADYKRRQAARKPKDDAPLLLQDGPVEDVEGCEIRLDALRARSRFRVSIQHPEFDAAIEGVWHFDNEELSQPAVVRHGDADTIETEAEILIALLEGDAEDEDDDDDDDFSDFLADMEDDDDDLVAAIGDDPSEPPPITTLERNRLKAIAKRTARSRNGSVNEEDIDWLMATPQSLASIVDFMIEVARTTPDDKEILGAWAQMLGMQLEFVRYRQDRGWEWADDTLIGFQSRLIDLGRKQIVPNEVFYQMCTALTVARVPVSDEVSSALAEAGFVPMEVSGTPQEMQGMLRGLMEEMAEMVATPFEVQEVLQQAGAMLPVALRGFMATEFALSEVSVLRQVVPLLLLDPDASVRDAAAGALDQTAHPEQMAPETLRRAIALRTWIPTNSRPRLDGAIRKARLAGIEIGAWPQPAPDLEWYASMVDGSGAQSLLVVSRSGKKGLFGGILHRQGEGIADVWVDREAPRGQINKTLKEGLTSATFSRADPAYIDGAVQHAIADSVRQGKPPPTGLLELAELAGGADWREQTLDVAAEAKRLFEALPAGDQTVEGVERGLGSTKDWMNSETLFESWFEDGPETRSIVKRQLRSKPADVSRTVLEEILPSHRTEWAERFLLIALWCLGSTESRYRSKAAGMVHTAYALTGDRPLSEIAAMHVIADTTAQAAMGTAW